MAARSLSSRDIRFSEAVNVPCDRGDGRTGRKVDDEAEVGVVEAVDDETVVVDKDGDSGDARDEVAVDADDDDDVLR